MSLITFTEVSAELHLECEQACQGSRCFDGSEDKKDGLSPTTCAFFTVRVPLQPSA